MDGWETKRLATRSPTPLEVHADDAGTVWVLVGMDSGFEARSEVFLRKVAATFVRAC